jgi:enoyl-CoA hydratase/carnithine racemase
MAEAVSYRVTNGVAWLTIERPEARNALNAAVREGLYAGVRRFNGDETAKVLVLTGDPVSAQRGYEIGLVNDVVPPADLRPRAQQLAERIAANAPLSVLAAKRTAYLSRPDLFDEAERIWAPVYHSADAQEGPAAFRDKRPPVWTGR